MLSYIIIAKMKRQEGGYTLVELLLTLVVLAVLALGAFDLFTSLLHSAIVAQREAAASTLATNQMEYLKSLPYDKLAVAGGAIVSTTTIPASFTKKIEGVTYTVTTGITYVDNAYDGCGSYPTLALKQKYCRDYPAPSGAPATDNNAGDYKDMTVTVTDKSGLRLATVDSHAAALVAETASNTGALFVYVVDSSGNPVVGATVIATNSTTTPTVNVTDTSDSNGIVIFYDLPPSSSGNKYVIAASNSGYSSLTTIAPTGSLQPTYSSQNLIAQSSSYITLTLKPQGTNSLVIETVGTTGTALPGAKIYVKGGYKKYTLSTDTTYYYDTLSPSDIRPTTDGNGLAARTNLVPGNYVFCGDLGATSCSVGGTTYYLAAAVPYGGSNPLQPIMVPIYDPANPPSTTYSYNSVNYLQKVRLILTTNASFPRVSQLSPSDVSLSTSNLANFAFNITGVNVPCSATAASCATIVRFTEGANTYTAVCTGTNTNNQQQLSCTVNLTGLVAGTTQLIVNVGANTLTMPASPLLGGLIVTP